MDEKRAPAVCPICGQKLIAGMVGIKDPAGRDGGYDSAIQFYPETLNKRGETVPNRKEAELVEMPYGSSYGLLFDNRCYFKQAGHCPACGKIVLLLDTVSGPRKTEE